MLEIFKSTRPLLSLAESSKDVSRLGLERLSSIARKWLDKGQAGADGSKSGTQDNRPEPFNWSKQYRQRHPWKTAGVAASLGLRYFYAATFVWGFTHKAGHKWMTTNVMQQHFKKRLADLPAGSFNARYLKYFGIPMYRPIALFVTLGQCSISISMLSGTAVRPHAALGLFMLLNFVAGGFGNPSILPYLLRSPFLLATPTGQWLGLDKTLHRKFPAAKWFR